MSGLLTARWHDVFLASPEGRCQRRPGVGNVLSNSVWDIRRQGKSWSGEEAVARHALAPEKIEMVEGRLLWSDEERLNLLGLLLENLGADAVVRLGNTDVWREAIAALDRELERRIARLEGRLDEQAAMSGQRTRCPSEDRPSIKERIAYLEGRVAGR